MHLSRKYIRKAFTDMGLQLSDNALDKISEKLKIDPKNNAFFNQSQKMIPLARVTSRTELKTWIRFWNRLN